MHAALDDNVELSVGPPLKMHPANSDDSLISGDQSIIKIVAN